MEPNGNAGDFTGFCAYKTQDTKGSWDDAACQTNITFLCKV